MALTLTVTRYRGVPPQRGLSVKLEQQGCTIGRDPGHDLVLPDPDRFVSTNHAEIRYEAGAFYLTDTSTNGTFVNHVPERIPRGHRVQLHDGDEITIGEYDLRVSITSGASTEAGHPGDRTDHLRKPETRSQSEVPTDIPEDIPAGILDPWRPEAGGIFPGPQPVPAGAGGSELSEPIPEGYDLLAELSEPIEFPEYWENFGESARMEREPRAGSSQSDHLPADREPYQPPRPDTAAPPAPDVRRPAPATRQPREARERMVRGNVAGQSGGQSGDRSGEREQDALAAFLAGLGMPEANVAPESISALMTTAGQLLRETTEGLMRVLAGRASIKRELRLGITTIRPAENNPLKFSVGAEDALTHLLFRRTPGYVSPVKAVQGAFVDIQAHELAVLAGLRAALAALLARFDPTDLDRVVTRGSVLDTLLSATRKARCWDLFTDRYRDLAADAEGGFLRLLSSEFNRAYEEQIRKLPKTPG